MRTRRIELIRNTVRLTSGELECRTCWKREGAEVNDDILKVEDSGGDQAQWREERYGVEHLMIK